MLLHLSQWKRPPILLDSRLGRLDEELQESCKLGGEESVCVLPAALGGASTSQRGTPGGHLVLRWGPASGLFWWLQGSSEFLRRQSVNERRELAVNA